MIKTRESEDKLDLEQVSKDWPHGYPPRHLDIGPQAKHSGPQASKKT